ncbi:MAG: hypothetical protein AAF799_25820 [Myxococcota bacterium]
MPNKTLIFVPVASMALMLPSCDDKPPKGMIDALTHAVAGKLLGCPTNKCTGVREINISIKDTDATLKKKAEELVKNWCPAYQFTSEKLTKNASGEFSKQAEYSVAVVGFGEISVTTEDYEAEVTAAEDGWKTQLNHSHETGTGECQPDWPVGQCKVQAELEVKSDGEVKISWIAGTETKTASGKGSKFIKFKTASTLQWCEKRKHDDPRTCTASEATDTPSTDVSCSDQSDCAGLQCGEWFCQDGTCTLAEAAPAGTPCEGGTCEAGGVCKKAS